MKEAQFQGQVIDLAHVYRWRVAHFRPAQTARGWRTPVEADGAGFPDLVLTRPYELIFAELKAAKGTTSSAQDAWLQMLGAVADGVHAMRPVAGRATVEVYLWRPADFEAIHARLAQPGLGASA